MDEFCTAWFQGFTQGLAALPASARETLLSGCATACAETGARQRYEALFADAGRDRDAFFARLSEIPGVRGTVLVRGRVYEVIFPHCACDLHTRFGVNDRTLCECSLRSILHVLHTLEPAAEMRVERVETVLDGGAECRFRVTYEY